MEVTKPYEFIGLGAMDVTKPYQFYRFWGHGLPPEAFLKDQENPRLGQTRVPGRPLGARANQALYPGAGCLWQSGSGEALLSIGPSYRSPDPKPYIFIGFGDIYAPKPYISIGFGDQLWLETRRKPTTKNLNKSFALPPPSPAGSADAA